MTVKKRKPQTGHSKTNRPKVGTAPAKTAITIPPPNMKWATFLVVGTSKLVMNNFSAKARIIMREIQEAGSTAKKNTKKQAKNFQELYEAAKHVSTDGWIGIPASAFRSAMISACKSAGFAMTRAKISVFVEGDGIEEDGTDLVKITKGKAFYGEDPVRLASGVIDIRPRPRWLPGWEAKVRIRWDADQFTLLDVTHLLMRAGMCIGILEGRWDSKKSAGLGWGCFELGGQPS